MTSAMLQAYLHEYILPQPLPRFNQQERIFPRFYQQVCTGADVLIHMQAVVPLEDSLSFVLDLYFP
jgi:hypothetical protein